MMKLSMGTFTVDIRALVVDSVVIIAVVVVVVVFLFVCVIVFDTLCK